MRTRRTVDLRSDAFVGTNVFVLFDTSNYMYRGFVYASDAIADFVRGLDRADSVAVYTYSRNLSRAAAVDTRSERRHHRSAKGRRRRRLGALQRLLLTLRDAAKVPGRKVVIVFSNGPDNASMVAPDDVRAVAEDEGIPIYVISTNEVNKDPISSSVFKRISTAHRRQSLLRQDLAEAGGSLRDPSAKISGNSYTVTYYPKANPNEGFRKITIERVRSRQEVAHPQPPRLSPQRRVLMNRRLFLTGATAASNRRVLGANDRIGVGFIGFGLIGERHVLRLQASTRCRPGRRARRLPAAPRAGRGACGGAASGATAISAGCSTTATCDAVVRLDARPLARPDDDDGLRGGQGRLRREAAEPVRSRGPVDDRRRPASTSGSCRWGRSSARGPHYQKARELIRERLHRQGHRVRACGPTATSCRASARPPTATAARARLRPVARPAPRAAVQSEPRRSTISAGSGTTPAAR